MNRLTPASLLAIYLVSSWATARAQDAPRFRWQVGQVLNYQVEHVTTYSDKVGESRSENKSVVKTTKRWQVSAVDAQGVATVQLSLTTLAQERTTSTGDVLKYDSSNPEKGTPELKAAMAKYLNTTLAILRVDPYGRVVEVKESKTPATTYEVELPFLLMVPGALPKAGQAWERKYKITLTPPLGTGEKYDATQQYICKEVAGDRMKVAVTTVLKTPLKAPADGIPLWQMMPAGEIVFDLKSGRLQSATLAVTRELKNHQGENSEVKFTNSLKVVLLDK